MREVRGTVNQVELIGWIGNAPDQRTLSSGVMVCNFNIATKRLAGRNSDGERMIETDWTPVEAWERLADRCMRFLHKGSRVRVSGALHTQSWEDRETGQRRYKTFVRADEVIFLDARQENAEETGSADETDEDVPF